MVTGTKKFFKYRTPEIIDTKTQFKIIYDGIIIDRLDKRTADVETLEKYANRARFIRNNPREYLIENGLLQYKEGQTVMFCHSEIPDTDHTLDSSVFIITSIHRNSKGVPICADIAGYYGNPTVYEGVNISDLEPI